MGSPLRPTVSRWRGGGGCSVRGEIRSRMAEEAACAETEANEFAA